MKELNVFCFIINLFVTLLMGSLMPILPALTRKSFLFGVRIPPEKADGAPAKSLKKRYIAVCLCGAALVLALDIVQFIVAPRMTLLATAYFPLLFVLVLFAAFLPNHRAALRLKKELGWQLSSSAPSYANTSFTRGSVAAMPWAWYVAAALIVLASGIIALARYPVLPEQIATHFDINSMPDAWAKKSVGIVLLMPIVNLGTTALMWLLGLIVEKARLSLDESKFALSLAQHRAYRKRMGHAIGFLSLGVSAMLAIIGFSQLWTGLRVPIWILLALALVPCVLLVVVSLSCGQGGCRLKPAIKEQSAAKNAAETGPVLTARDDDRLWALGMFYHNPDDPSIFVGDRFGNNIGLNYSRLPVKIGSAILALLTIGAYVWFTLWWLNFIV